MLVFDSGLGGLTVARALRRLAAGQVRLDYAADFAGFPYGDWEEDALKAHLVALMGRLLQRSAASVVVIACNTASTVALEALRAQYPHISFVGTVPAIKPAAQATQSGVIGVLATPGTVRREYTEKLVHTFAWHHRVVLHGARGLAALAEEKLRTGKVDGEQLRREIAPAFVQAADGAHTDVVVLGCTHYPLLLPELRKAAPWPVLFIDPSDAIARQALRVMQQARGRKGAAAPLQVALLTGEAAGWTRWELVNLLEGEGFGKIVMLEDA